jgi:hypothetical protein
MMARHAHAAHDVELEQAQPVFVCYFGERFGLRGTEIIDQDIRVLRGGDERRGTFRGRDIR